MHFYTLDEVCEILAIEKPQAYSLVRSGRLRAIKRAGRGQWRVEEAELRAFVDRAYAETEAEIHAHNSARTAERTR